MTYELRPPESRHSINENGCWVWQGYVNPTGGYGFTTHRGQAIPVHKLAWVQQHGPVPEGFQLHHRCGNRLCLNIDHLEVLSPAEHGARHAQARTACRKGHGWIPENTYIDPRGYRQCRRCRAEAARQFRVRQAA